MTDFAKFIGRFVYSKNSDYSDPNVDTKSILTALTPDEWEYREIQVDTGGNTIDLGHFATITGLHVVNLDDTNFVTAAYSSASTTCSNKISALGQILLANVDITVADDLVLTADTAACECLVAIVGT